MNSTRFQARNPNLKVKWKEARESTRGTLYIFVCAYGNSVVIPWQRGKINTLREGIFPGYS